jgi:hypothetical protein
MGEEDREAARRVAPAAQRRLAEGKAEEGGEEEVSLGRCLLAGALLAISIPASADPWVELEERYWITNLDARARASFSSGPNFEFDLPNETRARA